MWVYVQKQLNAMHFYFLETHVDQREFGHQTAI